MRYSVVHSTAFAYSQNASSSRSLMHLTPRRTPRQRVLDHRLAVDPTPMSWHRRDDWFGNHVSSFEVRGTHCGLTVVATSELEVDDPSPLAAELSPPWEDARELVSSPHSDGDLSAAEFSAESPLVPVAPAYAALAATFFTPRRRIIDAAVEFNSFINRSFAYQAGVTTISTPVDDVLRDGRGVCQDFAHVAISSLRSLGLAARYVSGYVETESSRDGSRLTGADASHAWISLHCGDLGWVDLDPTNDCIAGVRHVMVAYGRDFADVSPIKGVIIGGGHQDVSVSVSVRKSG